MSDFYSLVDKATSPLLLDIDWETTIQIVDMIRQGDVTGSNAIQTLLPKLNHGNPNVVLLALQVLESIAKNCGQAVHEHIASWDFMSELREILKKSTNEDVQKKLLLILGTWVHAFREQTKYQAVQDTVNILKAEGYKIPSVSEGDAMFTAYCAPDWADSSCCHRCRSNFTMIRRKHHCRACGQVFCNDCSSKFSTIPKFGIEREVRVCDHCYDDINNFGHGTVNSKTEQPKPVSNNSDSNKPSKPEKSAEELREEEELQLALALSKSEAENKVKEKLRLTSDLLGGSRRPNQGGRSSPPSSGFASLKTDRIGLSDKDPVDSELAKYLNRSYWEDQRTKQRPKETVSNAPPLVTSPVHPSAPANNMKFSNYKYVENGEGSDEVDEFMSTLRSQLEIFVNRMRSNQSRGRPIANDTAVQSLFVNITAMHAQLLTSIQDQDRKRVHGEHLQDKITQIRDARAALDALREEHRDKLRREREEQERQRQIQMMQKLEIMRKKKQEYLEYQRQLALHRMAESERQIFSNNSAINPSHPTMGGAQPAYPTMAYPQNYVPNHMPGYMYPQTNDKQGPVPMQNIPYQMGPNSSYPPATQSASLPPGTSLPTMAMPPQNLHSNPEFGQYPMQVSGAPHSMSQPPPPTNYGAPTLSNAGVPVQETRVVPPQPQQSQNTPQMAQPTFQEPEEAPLISFD